VAQKSTPTKLTLHAPCLRTPSSSSRRTPRPTTATAAGPSTDTTTPLSNGGVVDSSFGLDDRSACVREAQQKVSGCPRGSRHVAQLAGTRHGRPLHVSTKLHRHHCHPSIIDCYNRLHCQRDLEHARKRPAHRVVRARHTNTARSCVWSTRTAIPKPPAGTLH